MKKYSILLIFAFLMQLFSLPVSGEDLQNGWTVSYHGEFVDEEGRAKYLAEAFERYKFDGAKSVVVKCQTSDKVAENYVELKNTLVSVPETGIYTLILRNPADRVPFYIGQEQAGKSCGVRETEKYG